MILTDASGNLPRRHSRGAAALGRRGLVVHGDEARHEVVPRAAHGAALVLLVVVVVGVPAPDADAERSVLAAAAAPELSLIHI